MSQTHHDGQVLTECPECSRTIRLNPPGPFLGDEPLLSCGSCGTEFRANRETGEVLTA